MKVDEEFKDKSRLSDRSSGFDKVDVFEIQNYIPSLGSRQEKVKENNENK